MLRVLIVLAATVSVAPAWGQSQRVGREQTITRHVAAGGTVRVYTYAAFNQACEPRTAPQVALRTRAAHGTVAMQPGTVHVEAVGETAADCLGRDMPGIALFYTAQPGFHGTEQFDYDVIYQNGRNRHDTAIIEVR